MLTVGCGYPSRCVGNVEMWVEVENRALCDERLRRYGRFAVGAVFLQSGGALAVVLAISDEMIGWRQARMVELALPESEDVFGPLTV